jgi:regulator of sigma E protease
MLTTLLAAVLVLGPVIVFHEFGHFIVAKLAGIYVKTFSIGFGPKLLKLRAGETEYALSLLPLGGYVRMAGESTEEPETETGNEPADAAAEPEVAAAPARVGEAALYPRDGVADADIPPHRHLRNKPIATRLAVVTAGPFANLVLAIVVMTGVLYHEGMHVPPTTTLAELQPDRPEYQAGLRGGDVVRAIGGKPVTNTLEVAQQLDAAGSAPVPFTVRRGDRDTTLVLPPVRREAGALAFPSLGWRLDGRIGLVKKDGPADRAGLRAGDRIVEIDGQSIQYYDELANHINPAIGRELDIVWERDGQRMHAKVTPEADEQPVGDSLTEVQKIGRIQIEPYNLVMPVGLGRAFVESLERTWGFTRDTLRFLGMVVRGKGSKDAIGGPIRIGQVAGSQLRWGYSMLFLFMAFFSVNLFLLNMLPIPVLDGGHVLFLVIEAVRGEALSARVQELALRVGVSALIALMGYVVFMDFWRVITR